MFLDNTADQEYVSSELEEMYKEMDLNYSVTIPSGPPAESEEKKKPALKRPETLKPEKAVSSTPKVESAWARV